MKHYITFVILLMLVTRVSFAQAGYDTCSHLKEWRALRPTNPEEAQQQYDSLRLFIEQCSVLDSDAYFVFTALDGAVGKLNPLDTMRYERYRDWLISVLYLNTVNPSYFCRCIGSIAGTYHYGKYDPTNAGMAVINYARHISACYSPSLDKEYTQDSLYLLKNHKDTAIPSLDDLGLGFLLTHQAVSPSTALPTIYLASFTSTPNPFKAETTLSFELNRMAYVTVEVFDPLGRKVWGDDHGYSVEKGLHTIDLNGAKLSSGSYYARISTGFGEVKTVKLVRE